MSTSRMEAFSDGVFAVAITLLSLGLVVPSVGLHQPGLGHDLARQWPRYVAYAVSFLTIGIVWINHHVALSRLRSVDHPLLILNVVLLLSVGALPFGTNLMALYLNRSHDSGLAAAVYAGLFAWMGICFSAFNWFILMRRAHFLEPQLSAERRRRILVRSGAGVIPYLVAVGCASLSAYVALAICAALALYYALPAGSGGGGSTETVP